MAAPPPQQQHSPAAGAGAAPQLAFDWQEMATPDGRKYYVNHACGGLTQWHMPVDPRSLAGFVPSTPPPGYAGPGPATPLAQRGAQPLPPSAAAPAQQPPPPADAYQQHQQHQQHQQPQQHAAPPPHMPPQQHAGAPLPTPPGSPMPGVVEEQRAAAYPQAHPAHAGAPPPHHAHSAPPPQQPMAGGNAYDASRAHHSQPPPPSHHSPAAGAPVGSTGTVPPPAMQVAGGHGQQATSGGKRGKLTLKLDKPYYMAGDTIRGTAEITLHEAVEARKIEIKFKGAEKVQLQWWEQPPGENQPRRLETARQSHTFFKDARTLYEVGHQIAPGTYTYPFEYTLPAKLPGSFWENLSTTLRTAGKERGGWTGGSMTAMANDGSEDKGVIMYKVKCELDCKGKDLKCSTKLIVAEPVVKEIKAYHEKKEKTFLLASGRLKCEVKIAKNVFVPGEEIPVTIEADNSSSKRVEAFKVKLVRKLVMRAKHRTERHEFELYRESYPGVDKKSKCEKTFMFKIRDTTLPSTDGKLIDCNYSLIIEADVKMAFDLQFNPKCTIALLPAAGQPVQLYSSYQPFHWGPGQY